MPPPTLMIPNIKGGGSFTVHKLLNGTTLDPTQDGSTISAAKFIAAEDTTETRNPMIEAFGKRWLVSRQGIRERDQGGDGNWGLAYTATNINSNFVTGLHLAFPNAVPTLVWGYIDTLHDWQVVRTTDGVNFTTTLAVATPSNIRIGRSFVFGDLFFWNAGQGSDTTTTLLAFNVANDSVTEWRASGSPGFGFNVQQASACRRDFAVLNDTLYMILLRDVSSHLFRLDGLTWTNVFGGSTDFNADDSHVVARPIIFPWGESLVVFLPGDTGVAPRVVEVTDPGLGGSPGTVDRTVATGANGFFPTFGTGYAFSKYLDTTNPASPTLYIWGQQGGADSGTYDCYQWNGTGAPMSLVGAGVAGANYSLPNDIVGGGIRIPAAPAARPVFDGLPSQDQLGRRRYFRVYGTGADLTLQQAHNVDQQAPSAVSTLVAGVINLEDPIDATGLVGNLSEAGIEAISGELTTDLEAYYKFENNGNDSSGNGLNLSLTGAVPFVAGLLGQAADFPGANTNYWSRPGDDASLDIGVALAPFAVAVWINVDSVGTIQSLVTKADPGVSGWGLTLNADASLSFTWALGGSITSAAGVITVVAGWQHIVVTSDGTTTRMYVDGAEVTNGASLATIDSTASLLVGNRGLDDRPLDGQMDELAIWSRYVGAGEVEKIYNAGTGYLLDTGSTVSAGDAYVLTAIDGDRTLNPGGLTGLIPGDIVQYVGGNWTLAKQVVNVEKRLEGYWKFDGDGTDRTGNGRDLTLTGAVPFVSGLVDQAADIPGTLNNYWARTTNDDAFNVTSVRAWTLSAWVNIDTLPGTNGHIVSKKGLAGTGWELYVNSAGDARFQAGGSTDLTGAGLLSVGAGWQHLVVVFYGDGVNPGLADGTAELYVDGVSVATDVTATGLPSTSPLNIGRDPSSNSLYLDGQVDEVAIWSRALSASEVTALYNAGSGRELGYPDLGTHATLNSTTALIAPYTDGVDDGKTVSFAGESVDGTVLSTPTVSTSQIVVTPDEGASKWSYIHNTTAGGDNLAAGTVHTVMLDPV